MPHFARRIVAVMLGLCVLPFVTAAASGAAHAATNGARAATGDSRAATVDTGDGASGPSAADRAFLDDAASGSLFEVAGGELARMRAVDPRVRAFGLRMVMDHAKGYQQLRSLDMRLNLVTPFAADRPQRSVLRVWAQLSGRPFDCSYLPAEYTDHVGDVQAFQNEAQHGNDARVRAFAAAQLPTLLVHRQLAEQALVGLSC